MNQRFIILVTKDDLTDAQEWSITANLATATSALTTAAVLETQETTQETESGIKSKITGAVTSLKEKINLKDKKTLIPLGIVAAIIIIFVAKKFLPFKKSGGFKKSKDDYKEIKPPETPESTSESEKPDIDDILGNK